MTSVVVIDGFETKPFEGTTKQDPYVLVVPTSICNVDRNFCLQQNLKS